MKTHSLISTLVLAFISFSTASYSQATATATATATVITPISISKTSDMNFGNIAVNASGGTVVLAPQGTRTSSSGVTLPASVGTVSAAVFGVSGEGTSTYAITLPSTVTLTCTTNSGQTMVANAFTSSPSSSGTLSNGSDVIAVGATLTVAAGQFPGVYTSATFPVTVNYN